MLYFQEMRVQTIQRFLLRSHEISNNDGSTAISLKVSMNAYVKMKRELAVLKVNMLVLINFLDRKTAWEC
jgi:hypothetical protein